METELILGGVLTSLVGGLFFLRSILVAKKAKLTTEKKEVTTLDKSYETEPDSQTIATDITPPAETKETVAVVEKEAEVKTVEPAPKIEKELKINELLPQDSMLRRHYLTHLEMMLEVIYAPYPTDSALKRHYQAMISAKIEDCLNDTHKMAIVTFNYEVIKATLKKKRPIVELVADVKSEQQECPQGDNIVILPEDSVQRRHYLTNVRSIIESNHTSRPTDSALKRHYDTMINTEIETYLLDIAA